jgi:putative ABC transport system permease protein
MGTLWQDVKYGLRGLWKAPVFTAIAILTLALGIGANTAIFSVVDAVLLRPLPYASPSQLVSLFEVRPEESAAKTGASYPNFEEWREQNRVFSEMAGMMAHDLTLTGRGEPSIVRTVVVTSAFFALLRAKPLVGRTFLAEDGKRGATPVVILSEALWRSRFGADAKIVGRSITLDKRAYTVVGVMPAEFRSPLFTASEEIWIPLAQDPLFSGWMSRRGGHWLRVLGRLKPGVTPGQAQAQMEAIGAGLAKEFPAENAGWSIRIEPLQQVIVGNVRVALLVLLGAVGLVLLIACANIANLLLTRATSRVREMGIRIALGAGRARIIRQLLTESALLGLAGGAVGVALAYWGVEGLVAFLPADLPQLRAIRVDGSVLGFALLLSLAAGFVFGLAPALLASDCHLQTSLKDAGGRSGGDGAAAGRARNVLAVAEIALAMVLLVAAGLLLHSFVSLTSVNPGFDARRIWKTDVSLPRYEYSTPQQWTAFSNQLLERIQAQPGLRDSALAVPLPLVQGYVNLGFEIVGNAPLPPGTTPNADYVSVSPDYFHVMGIPLLRGRLFNRQDSPAAPPVAIISQAMARRYFPHQNPLGRQMVFGFPPDSHVSREIVGVVGDVRDVALHQAPGPMMYVPFAQGPFWGGTVVVKSTMSPASVVTAIREQVRAIDPDLPVTDFESMSYAVETTAAQPRFRALLLGLFGLLALVLAAAGIFGVISYSVSRRTHELGIRIALGASPHAMRQMVLGEGGKLAAEGLGIGAVAALVLTRFLRSELYGIGAMDPATFVGAGILLAGVALAACYVPARRAMRIDPISALRDE